MNLPKFLLTVFKSVLTFSERFYVFFLRVLNELVLFCLQFRLAHHNNQKIKYCRYKLIFLFSVFLKKKTIKISEKQTNFLIFVNILFSVFIDDVRLIYDKR